MKANEFIKKFGINMVERDVAAWESGFIGRQDFIDHFGFDLLPELKRLVASHKIVESYGGLDASKKALMSEYRLISTPLTYKKLHDAVADVESCQ